MISLDLMKSSEIRIAGDQSKCLKNAAKLPNNLTPLPCLSTSKLLSKTKKKLGCDFQKIYEPFFPHMYVLI